MTRDEFSRCLALVDAYWPHGTSSWTAEAIEAWESLLLDLDYGPTVATVQVIACHGDKFPPGPGELRRRTFEMTSHLPDADEAWGEVVEQIRKVGSLRGELLFKAGETYDSDDEEENVKLPRVECSWSHPLIGEVADRMGWKDLCSSENPMADRAHFLKLWGQALERERTVVHMPPAARALLESAGIALPNLSAARALEPA